MSYFTFTQDVQPVLSTSGAYADGDLMADPIEIPRFFPVGSGVVTVDKLIVRDTDDLGPAFELYFTKSSTTWGTLGDPVDLSAAKMADIVGTIPVTAGDWVDFTSSKWARVKDQREHIESVNQGTSIYVALVCGGTPNYSNADALTLRFVIEVH